MKRLWNATVWSPNGVRPEDWRYRGIFRFVLPITDLLFLYFGAVGWANGVSSVQAATDDAWQTWWSGGIAAAALVALLGVAVPRLWPIELVSKILLIGLVSFYVTVTLLRGFADPNVTAVAGLIMILILLPIWRVGDLAFGKRGRR